ncbi:MAG: beta-N-acetylhexosaminidase [Clostridiales bacterium]|nr:beta-N-acetylhexosaminidase [Clostridiales bacterium]
MKINLITEEASLLKGAAALAGHDILLTGAEEADLQVTAEGCSEGLCVEMAGGKARIGYSRRVEFFRGLSLLLEAFGEGQTEWKTEERPLFPTNGYMMDCSRNAVPTVAAIQEMIVMLALMGLDTLQLYTEDLYELEGEPYFGYMRGRYTEAELKEIDDFADALGVEVVPCIQTLAHLATAMRWPCYDRLKDCADILMAGEEETYALVEKMIAHMSRCLRSRRINIGMDEAHLIGLGRYREKHGIRPRAQIMLEHVIRVNEICRKYGLKPMMWSDMFFHLAAGGYSGEEGIIPPEVIEQVPPEVTLVYWEYYNADPENYRRVLHNHQQFRNPVGFAGAAWKWNGMLPELAYSLKVTRIALAECARAGLREVMATGWGDNGAECPLFAVLPALQLYAEYSYQGGDVSDERLASRLLACTGGIWQDFLLLDRPNRTTENQPAPGLNPSKYLLYQDVLMGLFDRHADESFPPFFAACGRELEAAGERNPRYRRMFTYAAELSRVLELKATLGIELAAAYRAGDRAALETLADRRLPALLEQIDRFSEAFYDSWMGENKPFGYEVTDIRLGGLRKRAVTARRRLRDYLEGRLERLEELEQERLPFDDRGDEPRDINTFCNNWGQIVTASVLN